MEKVVTLSEKYAISDEDKENAIPFLLYYLNYECNSVINAVWSHKHHPSYTSKSHCRNKLNELRGVYSLLIRATGYRDDAIPNELQEKYAEACNAAKSLYKREI